MTENNPAILAPPEVAAHLKTNINTLANWRCKGIGPNYVKIGGKVLYLANDIDAFILKSIVKCGGVE